MSRLRLALVPVLALLAVLAPATPASAGLVPNLECPDEPPFTQAFLRFLDPFRYRLAPGGDFEEGSPKWTLSSGAKIVPGNEIFRLNGPGDVRSLSIPSGAFATSADTCVSLLSPTLRFMAKSTGSLLGVLVVSADIPNGNGLLRNVPLGVVTGLGRGWRPSLPMVLTTTLIPVLGTDTSRIRFRFTPILGGAFQIDNVYVDPYGRG